MTGSAASARFLSIERMKSRLGGSARLAAFAALAWITGCGTPPSEATCGGRATGDGSVPPAFVAYASDFCGYHSWRHFDTTGGAVAGGIHDGSTVTEYLNRVPRHGSTAFPRGTIIVKEVTPGKPHDVDAGRDGGVVVAGQAHELFAMVKYDDGRFNSKAPALPGWAWYDLKNTSKGDDSVTVTWGPNTGPPAGDMYGGNAAGGCNTCHSACGNDGVCAKPLSLSNF